MSNCKVPKIGGHATPLSSSEKKEPVKLSKGGEDNHVTTLVREQVRLSEGGEDNETMPAAASVTGDVSKHVATKKTSDEKTLPLCPYGSSCYRYVYIQVHVYMYVDPCGTLYVIVTTAVVHICDAIDSIIHT